VSFATVVQHGRTGGAGTARLARRDGLQERQARPEPERQAGDNPRGRAATRSRSTTSRRRTASPSSRSAGRR